MISYLGQETFRKDIAMEIPMVDNGLPTGRKSGGGRSLRN